MHKINIYFSPLYIISTFITLYYGGLNLFCTYFLALSIHEFSHYIMSKHLGYLLNNLSFMPYGAKLKGDTIYKKQSHEVLIALIGPLVNLFLAVMIIAIWWLKPISYYYTYDFVCANLFIGLFNLIPLFPLDGGQVFLNLFKDKKIKKIVYKIMQIIGLIIGITLMIFFIKSMFNEINFSYLFVGLFLIVTSFIPYNVDLFEKVKTYNFKLNDYIENKEYIVDSNTNFLILLKLINCNYFYSFKFVDKNLKLIKTINQNELLNFVNSGVYYIKK